MSTRRIEVSFTPADFEALRTRDLSHTACVVFDVLRATSSMVMALANGAREVLPVAEIQEAVQVYSTDPSVILAGERDGLRITAALSGGVEFHLGNSPREFTPDRVSGKRIVTTTTNGTRALRACAGAAEVLVASFLNLGAVIDHLRQLQPSHLQLVCGGTFEEMAYEDLLAAGGIADALWPDYCKGHVADSALVARLLFDRERADIAAALGRSRNGKRLLTRPDLAADVAFCAQLNTVSILPRMNAAGAVR